MATLSSSNNLSKLELTFLRKEFPNATDAPDSEWIVGNIEYTSPIFSSSIYEMPMYYLPEITIFLSNLNRIITATEGIILYNGTEPYLSLNIILSRTGTATVSGEVWDVDGNTGKLAFSFETDQTLLSNFIEELKNIKV